MQIFFGVSHLATFFALIILASFARIPSAGIRSHDLLVAVPLLKTVLTFILVKVTDELSLKIHLFDRKPNLITKFNSYDNKEKK